MFFSSDLVSDNQKTGRAKPITLADGKRTTYDEAVVDVKTPYISGEVHALCIDSPSADISIGNNVIIVVPKDAKDIPDEVKRLEKINNDEEDKGKQKLDEISSTNVEVLQREVD